MDKNVVMPAEPPAELGAGEFDEALFNLCHADDYAGLYREFVKRYRAVYPERPPRKRPSGFTRKEST